jgi:hypothetical protein
MWSINCIKLGGRFEYGGPNGDVDGLALGEPLPFGVDTPLPFGVEGPLPLESWKPPLRSPGPGPRPPGSRPPEDPVLPPSLRGPGPPRLPCDDDAEPEPPEALELCDAEPELEAVEPCDAEVEPEAGVELDEAGPELLSFSLALQVLGLPCSMSLTSRSLSPTTTVL